MSENSQSHEHQGAADWTSNTLDTAVNELMQRGLIKFEMLEARSIWTLPYRLMIGQIRDANDTSSVKWIIAGGAPVDCIDGSVAATPREAARYFAMKWQLDAARYRDPSVQESLNPEMKQGWDQLGTTLAQQAEALYELTEIESHWQNSGDT
jgi:hypothetical protein